MSIFFWKIGEINNTKKLAPISQTFCFSTKSVKFCITIQTILVRGKKHFGKLETAKGGQFDPSPNFSSDWKILKGKVVQNDESFFWHKTDASLKLQSTNKILESVFYSAAS